MDEMYKIAQKATKCSILKIDEMYKIRDGWNVRN